MTIFKGILAIVWMITLLILILISAVFIFDYMGSVVFQTYMLFIGAWLGICLIKEITIWAEKQLDQLIKEIEKKHDQH